MFVSNPSVESFEDEFEKQNSEHTLKNPTKKRVLAIALNIVGLSIFVYFIFVALKLDGDLSISFKWIEISVLNWIAVCFSCFSLVFALEADYWRILDSGKRFLQILSIVISICLIIFFVLLSLKTDDTLEVSYHVAFAPLYTLLAGILCGIICQFPVLLDKRPEYLRDAILLTMDYLLVAAFLVVLALGLDGLFKGSLFQIFSFIFAIAVVNIISLVFESSQQGPKRTYGRLLFFIGVLIFAILLVLESKGTLVTSWFVILSPVFAAIFVYEYKVIIYLFSAFKPKRVD